MDVNEKFSLVAFIFSLVPFAIMVGAIILQKNVNPDYASTILIYGFIISVFFWILSIGFSAYNYTDLKNKGIKRGSLIKLAITHNIIVFILLTFFLILIVVTGYNVILSLV